MQEEHHFSDTIYFYQHGLVNSLVVVDGDTNIWETTTRSEVAKNIALSA